MSSWKIKAKKVIKNFEKENDEKHPMFYTILETYDNYGSFYDAMEKECVKILKERNDDIEGWIFTTLMFQLDEECMTEHGVI
jgi:hypothetical protein